MIVFWFIILGMIGLCLAFILFPLCNRCLITKNDSQTEKNIQIYNQSLQNLEERFRQGEIEEQDYMQIHLEIQRRLLRDTSSLNPPLFKGGIGGIFISAVFLCSVIPALACSLYFKWGD